MLLNLTIGLGLLFKSFLILEPLPPAKITKSKFFINLLIFIFLNKLNVAFFFTFLA